MYRKFMMRSIRCVATSLAILATTGTYAASTSVFSGRGHEPGLAGVNGILDTHFGMENLLRVDDSIDQYWRNGGRIMVKTLARWAGFNQSFGYIGPSGEFTQLLSVRNQWSQPASRFTANDSGDIFHFALNPEGAPLWSSVVSNNSDAIDHMVTWKITASSNRSLIGAYVTAWEDLAGGGDGDYNDLVMLIKGDVSPETDLSSIPNAVVPLPAALWLFTTGLLGLAAFARRNKLA